MPRVDHAGECNLNNGKGKIYIDLILIKYKISSEENLG